MFELCTYVCTFVCMYVTMYVCMYIYVRMYVYTYICICIREYGSALYVGIAWTKSGCPYISSTVCLILVPMLTSCVILS